MAQVISNHHHYHQQEELQQIKQQQQASWARNGSSGRQTPPSAATLSRNSPSVSSGSQAGTPVLSGGSPRHSPPAEVPTDAHGADLGWNGADEASVLNSSAGKWRQSPPLVPVGVPPAATGGSGSPERMTAAVRAFADQAEFDGQFHQHHPQQQPQMPYHEQDHFDRRASLRRNSTRASTNSDGFNSPTTIESDFSFGSPVAGFGAPAAGAPRSGTPPIHPMSILYPHLLPDFAYVASPETLIEAQKPDIVQGDDEPGGEPEIGRSSRRQRPGTGKKHNEKLRRDAFKTQLALLVRQIPGMGHHSETRKSVLICTREYIQQLQMREKRLRSQLMSHHLRERALTVALISRGVRPEDVAEEFSIGGIGPTELAQLDEAVEGLIDESAFPRPSSRGPPPHSGFNNEQQGGYPLIQSAAEFYAEPAWESSAPRSVARPMVTRPLAPLHRSSNGYPVLDNYQSQQSMGPAGYPPLPVSGHSASRRGFPVSDGIGFEVGGGYEAPMVTNGRRNEWRSGGW